MAWKISKTIQHFDKCIVMHEYVAYIVSSSQMFRRNTDRLARTVKRKMKKMIGKMVYEMPSIHFSFLSFRQHFLMFWVKNTIEIQYRTRMNAEARNEVQHVRKRQTIEKWTCLCLCHRCRWVYDYQFCFPEYQFCFPWKLIGI